MRNRRTAAIRVPRRLQFPVDPRCAFAVIQRALNCRTFCRKELLILGVKGVSLLLEVVRWGRFRITIRADRERTTSRRQTMQSLGRSIEHVALVLGATVCTTGFAQQGSAPPSPSPRASRALPVQQRLDQQQREIDALKQSLAQQENRYQALQRALDQQRAAIPPSPDFGSRSAQASAAQAAAQAPGDGASASPRLVQVGQAPDADTRTLNIAPLFEQPGVLTPRGRFVIEPSLQYAYSSSNQVSLVGYTVIPSLLIGLVDVRQVKQNTVTAALTGRYGVTNRLELEARVPYVYRYNSTVSREIFTGTASDNVFDTRGKSIGDVEVTARYQLNDGGGALPYLIGSLRFKSRTGKDPFEVITDCATRCIGNATGSGLPLDLPTGSGFYTLQPGITWLLPSDPVVFFGSFSYAFNFKRSGVSRTVQGGQQEFLGDVKAGNIFGMNFGMGLALNDKSSFSLGVDMNSIGKTRQNGVALPGSVRTTLATLVLGYSYRLSPTRTVNISVGAGLTRDTPDFTLTARIPMSF
jgi:hypothetical protein